MEKFGIESKQLEFGKPKRLSALALIRSESVEPDNEETRRMQKLIGRPMSSFAILAGGGLYIEFFPYGCLTVKPDFTQDIVVSLDLIGASANKAPF